MDRSSFLLAGAAAPFALAGPVDAQGAGTALTVELGDVSATKLPFIVASESGIYARNGLDVTQFITPAAAANAGEAGLTVPAESVKSGVVGDINIGGGSPTIVRMTTLATAPQRVILATNDNTVTFHVYARGNIRSFADLKGKRVGYGNPGALDQLLLLVIAQKMGWDAQRDWSLLGNVHGPEVAVKTGVDAYVGDTLAASEALRSGYRDLGDLSRYHVPILGSGVNALKSWLVRNRPAAASFIKATVEAIALVKTNKDAAYAAMQKWYGLSDPNRLALLYAYATRMPSKPYPSVDGLRVVRSVYTWREMQVHPPSYFIDPSFVAALDKNGYIDSLYKNPA